MSLDRPLAPFAAPALVLAALLGAGCGKSGQDYATNVGSAIDRSKAAGARGDMQSIAAAITSYVSQESDLPPLSDIHALAELLEPTYSRRVPTADPWGTEYRFESSGGDYTVQSAGQDETWSTDDDLEMQAGQMTKMPAGFQRL